MSTSHKPSRPIFIFILLLLTSAAIHAQEVPTQEISQDSLLNFARVLIDSARCRVFVSVDENGRPHARAMSPFPPEENMVIYLGTNPGSRKVKQIKNNPNVIVYYYEMKGASYVSIRGTARLVNDPEKKARYWKEGWERFYPDRDKDYILIEVTPKRLEMFSFEYNIMGKPPKWIPPFIDFTKDKE